MNSLVGKIALIAGGAGNVGEGIVRAFLKEGATVFVPSRTEENLVRLQERLGAFDHQRLITQVGNIGTEEGARRIRDYIENSFNRLDCVVASLGGLWQGSALTEVSIDTWNFILENNITPHFVVARIFAPVLEQVDASSYLMINSEAAFSPGENAGLFSVAAASQHMLKDVLAAERRTSKTRINSLVLSTPIISRSTQKGEARWLNAFEVGMYAAYLASDHASSVHGETIKLKGRSQVAAIVRTLVGKNRR